VLKALADLPVVWTGIAWQSLLNRAAKYGVARQVGDVRDSRVLLNNNSAPWSS